MTEDPAASGAPKSSGVDDAAFADKGIVKVRERTNASMEGQTRQDRIKLAQDKKLKDLLSTADEIQSLEHFLYWKDEFLEVYGKYLDPVRTSYAREADDLLYRGMQRIAKLCLEVKMLCASGAISTKSFSVKGLNTLNEYVNCLAQAEIKLEKYFPKKNEDEEECGYTKFNLAAILVRDGFRTYELMIATRDYVLKLMEGPLSKGEILKPNHKSIMLFYLKLIDTFCDTLADMGLFKLMNKCLELYKVRPRNKKKKKFNRETMGALSDTDDDDTLNGGRMFRRSRFNFRSIMDHGWTSGVTGEEVANPHGIEVDEEVKELFAPDPEVERLDPHKSNLWIYYFDPVSEKVGKIPRFRALSNNFIIRTDANGKEQQESSVSEWDGDEGKEKLIWTLKDACKGKTKKVGK